MQGSDQMELSRRQVMAKAAAISATLALTGKAAFSQNGPTMPRIEKFKIAIPDADVERIRRRVREARMPALSRGAGWTYGVDKDWFAELVRYWGTDFSWKEAEATLNGFAHYRADVSERKLHFVRIDRAANTPGRAMPLLLLHGWPYSFYTMLPLAGRL